MTPTDSIGVTRAQQQWIFVLLLLRQISLVEWFANHYQEFGATLEFVTNKSQEVRSY